MVTTAHKVHRIFAARAAFARRLSASYRPGSCVRAGHRRCRTQLSCYSSTGSPCGSGSARSSAKVSAELRDVRDASRADPFDRRKALNGTLTLTSSDRSPSTRRSVPHGDRHDPVRLCTRDRLSTGELHAAIETISKPAVLKLLNVMEGVGLRRMARHLPAGPLCLLDALADLTEENPAAVSAVRASRRRRAR